MRFRNDNLENNADDQPRNDQVHDDDRVVSDPVEVPTQRTGSPWSDAPGDAPAEDRDELGNRHDGDHTPQHTDPVDIPLDQAEESGRATTYGPDGTVTETTADHTDTADNTDTVDRTDTTDTPVQASSDVDAYRTDADAYRTDADAHRTDADADRTDADADRTDADAYRTDAERTDALKDDGAFTGPQAVDPVTGTPLANGDTRTETGTRTDAGTGIDTDTHTDAGTGIDTDTRADADTDATSEVAAVPVATESRPGTVDSPAVDKLFGDDSQSFKDRWRDVQLRFVDEPKAATAEAASLVDEAVDRLTASLKAQRSALTGDSEDTEKLRVELRGYRDILNKVLDL